MQKNKNKKESKTLNDLVILTQAYFIPKVKEVETVLNGLFNSCEEPQCHSFTRWYKCLLMVHKFYILRNVKMLSNPVKNMLCKGNEIWNKAKTLIAALFC